MTDAEKLQRAREAGELLDHPLLQAVFADCRAALVKTWRNSRQPEEREAAWFELEGLDSLEQRLRGYCDDRKLILNK